MRAQEYALSIVFLIVIGLPADAQESKWWESSAAIKLVSLKEADAAWGQRLTLQNLDELSSELDGIIDEGYTAIEVIAPAHGGIAWGGLDSENFYDLDPERGSMDDFRNLVDLAHQKDLKVMAFINVGYMGKDHPDWIQAQEEALTDVNGEKASWFVWADSEDQPTPDNPLGEQEIVWAYSEIAQKYYASVWQAAINWDPYEEYPTPQMDWNSSWPEEAERIVRHWMDTGLDGLSLDAPLEYFDTEGEDAFWSDQKKRITDIIREYHDGNVFIVAEAVYGSDWVNLGGYDAMWDYSLGYTWLGNREGNALKHAIDIGEAQFIHQAMQYRKEIVNEGGTLMSQFPTAYRGTTKKRNLYMASLIALGEALFSNPEGVQSDSAIVRLLRLKKDNPALWNKISRKQLETNNDNKYYAVYNIAKDESQRLLAVFNYQKTGQNVEIKLDDPEASNLKDVFSGIVYPYSDIFTLRVPEYGFRFFLPTNEEASLILGSNEEEDLILELKQNEPNPFDFKTTIHYSIPKTGYYRLFVTQMTGGKTTILQEGSHTPGEYKIELESNSFPVGFYLYTLQSHDKFITRKMVRKH